MRTRREDRESWIRVEAERIYRRMVRIACETGAGDITLTQVFRDTTWPTALTMAEIQWSLRARATWRSRLRRCFR